MSIATRAADATPDGARPAAESERFEVLDALRGFALLGIFVANLGYFSGWGFLAPEARAALAGTAGAELPDFIHRFLIEGKFYTVFSLLFGMGFAVMGGRLTARGADFRRVYLRRTTALLVIGLAHMCLVWDGDILTLYALCAFLLLAIDRWTTGALLRLAVVLIALPVPAYALFWLAGWPAPGEWLFALGDRFWQYRVGWAVSDGDALEMLGRDSVDGYLDWVLPGPLYRWGDLLNSWRLPKVLGTFLVGVAAGRALMTGTLLADRGRLKRVLVLGLAVGLPANAGLAWMGGLPERTLDAQGLLATTLNAVGVAPLGLAYAAGFALLWRHGARWLAIFTPAGRMALTNYLIQSVAGIAIFYGVGLGLAGRLPPVQWLAVGLAVYTAQLAVSALWLSRFRFGPLEWLWRCVTYGRLFPLRIGAPVHPGA